MKYNKNFIQAEYEPSAWKRLNYNLKFQNLLLFVDWCQEFFGFRKLSYYKLSQDWNVILLKGK